MRTSRATGGRAGAPLRAPALMTRSSSWPRPAEPEAPAMQAGGWPTCTWAARSRTDGRRGGGSSPAPRPAALRIGGRPVVGRRGSRVGGRRAAHAGGSQGGVAAEDALRRYRSLDPDAWRSRPGCSSTWPPAWPGRRTSPGTRLLREALQVAGAGARPGPAGRIYHGLGGCHASLRRHAKGSTTSRGPSRCTRWSTTSGR